MLKALLASITFSIYHLLRNGVQIQLETIVR
jgi:hypothetical protein